MRPFTPITRITDFGVASAIPQLQHIRDATWDSCTGYVVMQELEVK